MQPPADFARHLERDFNGRLRVRWSVLTNQWLLEERVGRAALPTYQTQPWQDDLIRAKDGYAFVLAVTPGDRMPCPRCRTTLRVPIRTFGEAVCPTCSAQQNRTVGYRASYWPLGEGLLEHLRKIDPLTDGPRRIAAEADTHNRRTEQSRDNDMRTQGEAIVKDVLNIAGHNPQVGYTTARQLE